MICASYCEYVQNIDRERSPQLAGYVEILRDPDIAQNQLDPILLYGFL